MAKNSVTDWDETSSNNTDVGGTNIDEGCAPSGINNAIRAVMSQVAKMEGDDTIASATTTDLGSVPGRYVNVSGTTTITGLGTIKAGTVKYVKFAGALTLTHNATSLILPGAASITTAAGDTAIFVSEGSGNWRCVSYLRAASAPPTIPRGHIFGLTLSNNATDPTNYIDIAAGEAASDDASPVMMVLASAMTKRLDAVWAAGTNQGMLASGAAIANTTYHIFEIKRPDTGAVDFAADTSAVGSNIAANTDAEYTKKRRIGSIVRTGGVIKPFLQDGDRFMWQTPVADVNASNPGASAVTRLLTVPLGIRVRALLSVYGSSTGGGTPGGVYISDLSLADEPADSTTVFSMHVALGAATFLSGGAPVEVYTNTAGQVRSRIEASAAGVTLRIATNGWVDARGRV